MEDEIIENPKCVKCGKTLKIIVYDFQLEFILCDKCSKKYKVWSNHDINNLYLSSIQKIDNSIDRLNNFILREQENLHNIKINPKNIINAQNEDLLNKRVKELQDLKLEFKEIREEIIKKN